MKRNEEARICELTDANDVKAFSANPTAVCRRCGAKAHGAGALCDPIPLSDAG